MLTEKMQRGRARRGRGNSQVGWISTTHMKQANNSGIVSRTSTPNVCLVFEDWRGLVSIYMKPLMSPQGGINTPTRSETNSLRGMTVLVLLGCVKKWLNVYILWPLTLQSSTRYSECRNTQYICIIVKCKILNIQHCVVFFLYSSGGMYILESENEECKEYGQSNKVRPPNCRLINQ